MEITERIELHNQEIAHAIKKIDSITAQFNICKVHLTNQLDTFEARFDRNNSEISYEECEDYCGAAEFLARFGRTNNSIRKVQEHLDKMPL